MEPARPHGLSAPTTSAQDATLPGAQNANLTKPLSSGADALPAGRKQAARGVNYVSGHSGQQIKPFAFFLDSMPRVFR